MTIAGIEEANAHSATKPAQAAIEISPGSPQLQVSDLNMPLAPISPVAYTVQSGDSLSGILGTSDPVAIGAFMRANGLTSSTIYPGEQLVMPSGGYTSGDEALGQATLNVDNQRIASQASQSYDGYRLIMGRRFDSAPTLDATGCAADRTGERSWALLSSHDERWPNRSLCAPTRLQHSISYRRLLYYK